MKTYIIRMVIVAVFYCVIGVLLYRGRAVRHVEVLQSDLIVFWVPAILAFVAYGLVFWFSGLLDEKLGLRVLATFFSALLAMGLSFWVFMLVAFNLYGT